MSRRSLLTIVALIFVALVLFKWRTISKLLSKPKNVSLQPKFFPPLPPKAKASLVSGTDIKAMIMEAVELVGGFDQFQITGKKVLIKPNVVGSRQSPTTTNPEVVRALCKVMKELGASQIWVGDMSYIMELPTSKQMKACGILGVVEEEGATPISFEDHRWVPVRLHGTDFIKEVYVSEYIYLADIVINVPVIKTHRFATYTIALKNFVGATHGQYRPYIIDRSHWGEIIAEINKAYQPALNIIDGTQILVSGGPWSGAVERPGVIIASTDRVAADVIGLSLLKTYQTTQRINELSVWKQPQIAHAIKIGLGINNSKAIELVASSSVEGTPDLAMRLIQIRKIMAEA